MQERHTSRYTFGYVPFFFVKSFHHSNQTYIFAPAIEK